MKQKRKRLTAFICAAVLLLSGCSGKLPGKEELSYTDTLFDTVISVRILDPADQDVRYTKSIMQKARL